MRVDNSPWSGGIISITDFYNMKVCCVFLLESPHWGDSNEYAQYTIFNIKQKIALNYPKPAVMGFFLGTREQFRNSRGKRAIRVRATEVLSIVYCMVCDCLKFYIKSTYQGKNGKDFSQPSRSRRPTASWAQHKKGEAQPSPFAVLSLPESKKMVVYCWVDSEIPRCRLAEK